MFIQINLESEEPIYLQLRHQIIAGIARNELEPGEALPSVRAFASDLGINLHTVNKTYQQLKQEGFILIHRQKGVVINPDGPPIADDLYKEILLSKMTPLIAEASARGLEEQDINRMTEELFEQFSLKKGESS